MTASVSGAADRASNTARRAARNDWITRIGRVGLVAYGVVNLLIAFLAIQVATGDSGEQANKNGALQEVAEKPFGPALLWIIAVALIGLAIWQFAEAIWGHSSAGKRRLKKRVISAGEGVLFAFLAFNAIKFAMGSGKTGSKTQSFTAKLLGEPFGQVLVGIVGVAIIVGAAFVIWHGFKKKFREDLDLTHADAKARTAAERFGQVGYMGIGAAYAVVGALVVAAAVSYDPDKASGLDGAMKTIASQPFGSVLLWLVALGFVCYGVYCFFDARYRKS
ncbi:DUF1206 domain-containing protein [Cryptosporangium phraense]|uniref:DUF1206 domain-containing protein n=1 Tax=Cryptosporangium phraense TaxID=2593070 RepID=A0A545AYT4_9ACTN|nr:DUF1206 domain-containing protein [Cryptosporangium phraense]TQS46481.1 DUF1206 domain-containing protein [Cryptosporangium phraense]